MVPDALVTAAHFAHTRWMLNFRDHEALENWQEKKLANFIREVLPRTPYYRDSKASTLAELPTMDKTTMMSNFEALNTRHVTLDEAFEIGFKAETTRDFTPMLNDLTVGLSSGTSGNRGVFLVSRMERLRWAGILLARALPAHLLKRLLSPWMPPLRVAFFLRSNSNLYTTLNSRRIDFSFYDLLEGIEPALPKLNASQPNILVGPPSLLRALTAEACSGHLHIAPSHIISVAEVLEEHDLNSLRAAFGVTAHQLYQATEGFLGYTCQRGTLHLNESFVHIEPDWLDKARTRFQPIVTDFTRETQLIVRYRLNDVLRVSNTPCPCGSAERTITAIDGRADEILWLPARADDQAVAIYPDLFRRAMLFAGPTVREFELIQSGMGITVGLLAESHRDVAIANITRELDKLWQSLDVIPPILNFTEWQAPAPGAKRRRIRLAHPPEGLSCTF